MALQEQKEKNWPTEFRKPSVLKLKRGESRKMQHEDVMAVVWQDKRVVLPFPQIPIPGLMVRSHEKQEKAMNKLKLHVLKRS